MIALLVLVLGAAADLVKLSEEDIRVLGNLDLVELIKNDIKALGTATSRYIGYSSSVQRV